MNYQGILYELQILEAVPCSASSPLESTQANIPHEAAGLTASATDIAKLIGATAIGSVPIIGNITSIGGTIYDALTAVYDNLSTSTVIDNAIGTALASITTHVKYIFVKRYQSPDIGNQVLCYMGSATDYNIGTTTRVLKYDEEGNKEIDEQITGKIENEISSLYYNEYTPHVQVYHNYKVNGISNFNVMYYLTKFEVSLCGCVLTFDIPFVYPTYI